MPGGSAFSPYFIRAEYDETGAFRQFENAATASVNSVKQRFQAGFGDIQRIVESALSRPRNAAGALDIDTSSLRRAAEDSRALALSSRDLANAAQRLARETGDTTEETRLFIQAARAAAIESNQDAKAKFQQVAALERLQSALDQTKAATDRVVASQNRGSREAQLNVASYGQQHQGLIQVGQQLQDITVGFASGQRAGTIFAQQLPQLALALQNMGAAGAGATGALARLSGFLSTPQGVGLTVAIPLVALFAEKLFGSKKAAEQTGDALGELASYLDVTKNSYETLTKVVEQYNRSQEKTNELTLVAAETTRDEAKALLATASARVALLQAELASQSTNINNASEVGNVAAGSLSGELTAQQDRIRGLTDNIREAERTVAELTVAGRLDAATAATQRYERAVRELRLEQQRGSIGAEEYQRQYERLTRQKNAQVEAIRAERRNSRRTGDNPLPSVTLGEVSRLIQSDFAGQITSTTGGRHARNSYHYRGQAVDFVPRGGLGSLSKDEIRAKLEEAGIDIRELLGPGDAGHSDHFHVAFGRRRLAPDQIDARGDAAKRRDEAEQRRAEALQRSIENSAEAAARLRGQFDEAPRDIDRANAAIINLNQIIAEAQAKLAQGGLGAEQVAALNKAINDSKLTRDTLIPQSLRRPITDRLEEGQRQLELDRLHALGLDDQAEALRLQYDLMRQLGVARADQIEQALIERRLAGNELDLLQAQLARRQQMSREAERLNRIGSTVRAQLQEIDGIRNTITQGIANLPNDARGALGGIFQGIRQQFNDLLSRRIFDNLFGDAFSQLELDVSANPRARADRAIAQSSKQVVSAFEGLATAASNTASALAGGAANDNLAASAQQSVYTGKTSFERILAAAGGDGTGNDIVVTAQRQAVGSGLSDPLSIYQRSLTSLFERFFGQGSQLARTFGKIGGNALEGSFYGQGAASLIFGSKTNSTGAAIGGALGNIAGKALGKTLSGLGGSIGGALGPIGSVVGGLIGSLFGGLFSRPKVGTAYIGAGAGGNLAVASYSGNNKAAKEAAGQGGDSVVSTVQRIADQLGATVDASRGAVSLTVKNGKYYVDPTGRGQTKTKKGAIEFGDNAEAAVRAATLNLIQDGVLSGLRATTNRILQTGKDLDTALQKALDFEGVFSKLKSYKDPVGAALDTLDKEYARLKRIFADANATTEEYAQLEELYGIERAKAIKDASDKVTSSLRSLYDGLTVNNDARSLRERISIAQATYSPLKARVAAGDQAAYDDYATAAQTLLDLQRQLSGSQADYFNLLDEITALTKVRIDAESNIAAISANRDSPFTSSGAVSGVANDNTAVVNAIDAQTQALLAGLNGIYGALVRSNVAQQYQQASTGGYSFANAF